MMMIGTEIHGTIQSAEPPSNEHHIINPSDSKNDKVHIVAPIMKLEQPGTLPGWHWPCPLSSLFPTITVSSASF